MAHIIVVLDKSGSMEKISHHVISGFNEFLQTQKRIIDDTTMTMLSFSDSVEVIFANRPLADIRELTHESYKPEGMTALNDAIGQAISGYKGNNRTLMVVITDGEENYSISFDHEQISQLIETKTSEGWKFIYLCNNLQTASAGNNLGFASARRGDRNPATQNLVTDQENFGTVLSREVSRVASNYRATSEVIALDELNSGISEMKINSNATRADHHRMSFNRSFSNSAISDLPEIVELIPSLKRSTSESRIPNTPSPDPLEDQDITTTYN
jgi:hypothetical protein